MAKEYYLYVKGKAIPVSEEVYKAYEKQRTITGKRKDSDFLEKQGII